MLFPISQTTLETLISSGIEDRGKLVEPLSKPELCALITILKLNIDASPSEERIERSLSELIDAARSITLADLRMLFWDCYDPEELKKRRDYLFACSIGFMSDKQVKAHDYLDAKGCWNWASNSDENKEDLQHAEYLDKFYSREKRVTDEEGRALLIQLSNPEESIDIQGMAGCGKTFTIGALLESNRIDKRKTLLAAMNKQQLTSLQNKVGRDVKALTFAEMASEIMNLEHESYIRFQNFRTKTKYFVYPEEVAKKLGIYPIGNLQPSAVVQKIQSAVNSFCYSADLEIQPKHFRKDAQFLDEKQVPVLLALANLYWEKTITPDREDKTPLPLRGHHKIKYISLHEETLPDWYSHIIVDEAHDLPASLISLFDRSPQSILTFGDDYQSFSNIRTEANRRHVKIRRKWLSHSYRAGKQTDAVYNGLLSHHPAVPVEPFKGAETIQTKVERFENDFIPDKPSAILSKTSWQVLATMQRLKDKGADYFILERTLSDLKYLFGEAIELFQGNITRCSHTALRKYASWDQLMAENNSPIFKQIDRLFTRGYSQNDFQEAVNNRKKNYVSQQTYLIARIEDVKNMQFSNVQILSGSIDFSGWSPSSKANLINHLYTGISRAQYELYLSDELMVLVSDYQRNQAPVDMTSGILK